MAMTMLETIKTRRSTREFLDRSIPSDVMMFLMEAAQWSPSGGNIQPLRIVVVQDRENIRKVNMFSPGLQGDAVALLVLCVDTSIDTPTAVMDAAIATQSIMLVATENELGSCAVRSFNRVALRTLLRLPSSIEPEMLISLGYPAKAITVPNRKPIESFVHWETYNDDK